jgi:hypothetical protein
MNLPNSVPQEVLDRITQLEQALRELGNQLTIAVKYIGSDPHSSLTKSRTVLERLLQRLYARIMGHPPAKQMVGNILADKDFSSRLPSRIRARMNFIRELANAGVHGGDITLEDAVRAICELVSVIEWYMDKFPIEEMNPSHSEESALEILPDLKQRLGTGLRCEVVGVKFVQGRSKCWLELTEESTVAGYLHNRLIKRDDLGFMSDRAGGDGLYFSPLDAISANVAKILELDVWCLANCTDLLTPQAAEQVYQDQADRP